MIIKTMRCKHKSDIGRLVDYVLSDKDRIQEVTDTFFLAHNMYARDSEGFKNAFQQNETYRKKRKNGVVIYHEVLAFSEKDTLTLEMLEDITKKYIELRADDAVVLAKPHIEEQHWHVHLLISGTAVKSSKTMRMDNKTFARIRRDIEQYQIEKYPELTHSIVHLTKPIKEKNLSQERDKNKRKERSFQSKKRMGKHNKLDKEKLQIAILQIYKQAQNVQEFLSIIDSQDKLEHYTYRGKLAGVRYGARKYRFTTLGISKEMLQELQKRKHGKYLSSQPQKQKRHNILASVFSEEELQRQLQENRKVRQVELFEKYQQRLRAVGVNESSKQKKKQLKILFVNLLNESKTMNQLLFFVSKIGLKRLIIQDKFVGIIHQGVTYSFKELGLKDEILKKQLAYERYKSKMAEAEIAKEQKTIQKEIEIQTFGELGFFFM